MQSENGVNGRSYAVHFSKSFQLRSLLDAATVMLNPTIPFIADNPSTRSTNSRICKSAQVFAKDKRKKASDLLRSSPAANARHTRTEGNLKNPQPYPNLRQNFHLRIQFPYLPNTSNHNHSITMASDIQQTPFVKQLAANGKQLFPPFSVPNLSPLRK